MTFTVRTDRRLIRPTYRSNRFALVEVIAPPTRREQGRPPVHLAFVIDRSGSMAGAKLRLAKQAVEEAIGRLQVDDRFAVVVYDEHVDVLMPTTHATAEARREALARLASVEARGSTDLGAGWLHGCEQVALALTAEGVNRCLLLTDGLANVGIIDSDELARHAGELRSRGVSTSTFGVGDDFDEALLQSMAASGGGHFYYIAEAATIRDHISSEVGETLDLVAREVTVSVTTPESVRVESLSPYPVREHAGQTYISLGDLTSEQLVTFVLRFNFPYAQLGGTVGAVVTLTDRDGVLIEGARKLQWEYADDHANDTQARDVEVDRPVARTFAARARQEAVARNRMGDFEGARRVILSTARRIRDYAGRDPELRRILSELEQEGTVLAAPMMELKRKEFHAVSSYQLRSRMADGAAQKSVPPDAR